MAPGPQHPANLREKPGHVPVTMRRLDVDNGVEGPVLEPEFLGVALLEREAVDRVMRQRRT